VPARFEPLAGVFTDAELAELAELMAPVEPSAEAAAFPALSAHAADAACRPAFDLFAQLAAEVTRLRYTVAIAPVTTYAGAEPDPAGLALAMDHHLHDDTSALLDLLAGVYATEADPVAAFDADPARAELAVRRWAADLADHYAGLDPLDVAGWLAAWDTQPRLEPAVTPDRGARAAFASAFRASGREALRAGGSPTAVEWLAHIVAACLAVQPAPDAADPNRAARRQSCRPAPARRLRGPAADLRRLSDRASNGWDPAGAAAFLGSLTAARALDRRRAERAWIAGGLLRRRHDSHVHAKALRRLAASRPDSRGRGRGRACAPDTAARQLLHAPAAPPMVTPPRVTVAAA
jgi:hypothetical protein